MSVTGVDGDGATRWSTAEAEHLLAFADDEHLIGQQHTEWIGTAPFLEEDLAFCSIAQDELGHAAALYELLGDVDGLAFGREPAAYRSCSLVEVPCVEWELAIARHWLYDLAERERWESIAPAGDHADHPDLAGVIARAQREEAYHRVHVTTLVGTLRTAGEASCRRLDAAIVAMLPDADALWQPLDGEPELVASGFLSADSATMQSRWRDEVDAVVGQVQWETLARPEGTRHERTPHFGPLYDRITEVFRLDPTATW